MPPKQKIVQVPGVGNIAFPATMADADINQAINDHLGKQVASQQIGAFQQKPGGPVLNANTDAGAATPGSVTREAALGLLSGFTGAPESQTPLKDMWSGMKQQEQQEQSAPWLTKLLHATFAPQIQALNMGKGIVESGKELAGSVGTPTAERGIIDSNQAAHAIGSMGGKVLQMGTVEKAGEAASEPVPKNTMQNIMNLGPAKADFIGRQVGKAQAVQAQVKGALDALHTDGKTLMGNVSSHIDAVKPEGVFDKADVAKTVEDAMGVVKADQKVPSTISRLTEKPEPVASKAPTVGGKPLDLKDPQQLKTYQKLKEGGAFSPEEIEAAEGKQSGDKYSFEALKQLHSDLGAQIASQHGAVEAGVKTTYGKLGDMLRKEAESHGLLDQWQEGVTKVKTFNNIAYRSPLKDTYAGSNHGQIMRPLISDDLGPQSRQMLEAISPYGIDLDALDQTVKGYKYGEKMDSLSEPSRMTPILAAISPKAAAIRTVLPQVMRGEKATNYLYGKGLDEVPMVKPNKVFPSKVAAAQSLKGGSPPPSSGSPQSNPPPPPFSPPHPEYQTSPPGSPAFNQINSWAKRAKGGDEQAKQALVRTSSQTIDAQDAKFSQQKLDEISTAGNRPSGTKRDTTIRELTSQISELRNQDKVGSDEYNSAWELRKQLREERRQESSGELNKILGDLQSKVRGVADKHYQETIPIQDAIEKALDKLKKPEGNE
jgi:hypothetical protein